MRTRLRLSSDRKKSLAQYDELKRSGKVEAAVVIALMKDEDVQILGQNLNLDQLAQLMTIAGLSLRNALEQEHAPKAEPLQVPTSWGDMQGPARKVKEITRDAEGHFVAPKGETIISCGECHHPRFYVLLHEETQQPARWACAHCGNEIKLLRATHEGGHA